MGSSISSACEEPVLGWSASVNTLSTNPLTRNAFFAVWNPASLADSTYHVALPVRTSDAFSGSGPSAVVAAAVTRFALSRIGIREVEEPITGDAGLIVGGEEQRRSDEGGAG